MTELLDLIQAPAMDTKTCTKCEETKPLTEYGTKGKKADGTPRIRSECNPCRRNEWAENSEVINAKRRRSYAEDPTAVIASNRKYYQTNRDTRIQKVKEWQTANPDKVLTYKKKYRDSTPDLQSANRHRRRSRLVGAFDEDVKLSVLRERDGDSCFVCSETIDFSLKDRNPMMPSLEHVIPLSKGGRHSYGNTAISHLRCNLSKGTKSLDEVHELIHTKEAELEAA